MRHEERAPTAMLPPLTRVRTQPCSPQGYPYRGRRHPGTSEVGENTVLPSIEGPDGSYLSPRSRQNPFDSHLEIRETNVAREATRNLRDPAFLDLAVDTDLSSKRRRIEQVPPLPEYRIGRRDSPKGYREQPYVPQSQAGYARAETRVFDYGELRSSPRLRQTAPALEPLRYVEHKSVYDVRDPPQSGKSTHHAFPVMDARHGLAARQSRYSSQYYGSTRPDDFEASTPKRLEQPFENSAPRVYEPIFDSRGYEDQNAMVRNGAVREQHAESVPRDPRTRYMYHSGSVVHEPLQELPHQRLLEYEHRPEVTAVHYTHVVR